MNDFRQTSARCNNITEIIKHNDLANTCTLKKTLTVIQNVPDNIK